ncbi:MAG: MFS transporter [Anaerolineae bacterium]|nr:MFS transporter [Anaerolineae bacterium]
MKTAHAHSPAAPAAATGGVFQTAQVVTIAAGHFIHDIFTSFLAPLLPLIIEKLSLSLTLAGTLSSFMQLPSLINPFLGNLADRVSVRWFVVAAPTITAAAMCLIGMAPSYLVMALLLIIAGFGNAIWHVPAPVMVARAAGQRVGRGMSFFMFGGEMARTVGPLLAVEAVSWWGLEGTYRLIPVGVAASLMLYLRTRSLEAKRNGGPSENGGALREAWRDLARLMLPLTGLTAANAFVAASLTTYLPTLLVAEGASVEAGGTALALLQFAGVLGVLGSGTLSDRLGRRRVLAFLLGSAPLVMLVFLAVDGSAVMVPVLFVLGFVALSANPVILALVQEHNSGHPATANGLFTGISFVARSLIVILIGALGDHLGLRAAFVISALVGFLGLPFVLLLPKQTPVRAES